MAAEALIAESTRTLAVSWRIGDFMVVFTRFAPDCLTVHPFLQPSRGEVTKFLKLSWGPQPDGLMEGKRGEMIGILDAARLSERSADSGRGKEGCMTKIFTKWALLGIRRKSI